MMLSVNSIYVVIDGRICSGRGLKSLCEKLNKLGYNIPDTQFEVYTYYKQERRSRRCSWGYNLLEEGWDYHDFGFGCPWGDS